ncbi:hypothetical protein J3U99_10680 [Brucella pituitosa]|uniref:hypothetical protein n=1 Tax=Brucella TaxID=234 RepID=UPI0004671FB7|nr:MULTISPECIES: hypothetical protein [Brucella]MCK4205232.1 hypothetical protein [Brucella pituitosa]
MTIEVGLALAILAAVTGAFWRMWDLITKAGQKGETASADLAAHKLHVAETYVTKAGMSEQTAQIMKAIDGVGSKIDRTNDRLDTFMQPKTTRTRG